ncbi:UNVERIFIED_CONTAM: hypothetical protein FKN15_005717 [Acipenser sinensis]
MRNPIIFLQISGNSREANIEDCYWTLMTPQKKGRESDNGPDRNNCNVGPGPTMDRIGRIAMSDQVPQWTG